MDDTLKKEWRLYLEGIMDTHNLTTLDQLSEFTGATVPQLSNWINEKVKPRFSSIKKISQQTGISFDFMSIEYSAEEKNKISWQINKHNKYNLNYKLVLLTHELASNKLSISEAEETSLNEIDNRLSELIIDTQIENTESFQYLFKQYADNYKLSLINHRKTWAILENDITNAIVKLDDALKKESKVLEMNSIADLKQLLNSYKNGIFNLFKDLGRDANTLINKFQDESITTEKNISIKDLVDD